MANVISEIVAPNVNPDLDGLINKLISVEKEIDNINGRIISVTVDVKGVESLNQLNALAEKQTVIYTDLNKVRIESAQATQQLQAAELQYGVVATGSVKLLVEQKQELQAVNDRIKELNNMQHATNESYVKAQNETVKLTAEQIRLKAAIAANSKELRDNVVQINNTSNSFNVLGLSAQNVTSIFNRMILRMVAYQLILAPIIAGVTGLIESFSKLSAAQQEAADTLKAYQDAAKALNDFQANEFSGIEVGKNTYESLINTIRDSKSPIEAVTKAYADLKAIMPGLTREFSMADIQSGKESDTIRKKANYINELTNSINVNKAAYADELKQFKNLEKQYLAGDPEPENHTTSHRAEQDALTAGYVGLQNDLQKRKGEILRDQLLLNQANAPDLKKEKKPSNRGMLDELELEKANSRARLDVMQETYDKGRKTFAEEKQLHDDQRAEAQLHYNNLIEILNKWKGKVGETREKYLARVKEAANEEARVDIKTNEEDAKIQEQIIKRHIAAGEAIDAEIDKLTKLRGELDEANAKLDETRRTAKSDHDYASGFGGVLEGIGFDTQTGQNLKNYDISIDKQKGSVDNAKDQLANEGVKGSGADPAELLKRRKNLLTEEDNLADLQAQRQDEIDKKILQGKKELGRKMVEAIKTAFDAIQTIQDNAFAYELQQNQIKQDQLQINKQQRLDAIEGETKFAVDKENEKSLVVAQSTAKQNELIKESQGIKIRQAKFDKEAAELKILVSTATAIAEVYATYSGIGPAGIAIATGIAAAIAAMGAAQYAAAASAPLPQFALGGTTTTPSFIAGEAGVEIIQPVDKPAYFTGSTAAVYHEKPGAKVIGNKDIVKYAADNIGRMDAGSMQAMYNNDVIMKEVAKIIGEKFEGVGEEMIHAIYTSGGRPIKNVININTNNNLQRQN